MPRRSSGFRPPTRLGQAMADLRGERLQADAAKEAGISRATWSDLEVGRHPPSATTARKLAKWLGWTSDQVFDAAETSIEE